MGLIWTVLAALFRWDWRVCCCWRRKGVVYGCVACLILKTIRSYVNVNYFSEFLCVSQQILIVGAQFALAACFCFFGHHVHVGVGVPAILLFCEHFVEHGCVLDFCEAIILAIEFRFLLQVSKVIDIGIDWFYYVFSDLGVANFEDVLGWKCF